MKSNADKLRELAARARVFLLDMEGTLYLGDTLIGDMRGTLRALRAAGKRAVYCTNNSSKTAKEYVAKLSRLGLWEEGDRVYTSGMAAAEYIRANHAGKKVFLVGTDALKEEFSAAGIPLAEEDA